MHEPGTALGPDLDQGTGGARYSHPRSAPADDRHRTEPAPGPPPGSDYPDRRSQRGAVVRLVVVVAALVAAFLAAHLGALLVVIVAIVIVVGLHELGHFVTAKASHMKVTEFFIGFGPRLWSIRKGETEYGIKPIPAGAYVKIPGMTNLEDIDPEDEDRTYRRQPFHNRIMVASAGSVMHYVIAFVLAWVAILAFGVPTANAVKITGFVTTWHRETAAQKGGIEAGDEIVSIDGRSITTATALSSAVQRSEGRPITLVVERDGRRLTKTVTPALGWKTTKTKAHETEHLGTKAGKPKVWLLGVTSQTVSVFSSEGPLRGLGTAAIDVGRVTAETVTGLGHVFSASGLHSLYSQLTNPQAAAKAAANPAASDRVTSIVGAARIATQAEQAGVLYLIEVLIALNVVFGLLNMLPMLPLDGGHVALAVYERIRTRRGKPYYQADAGKLVPVAYVFMALLLVFVGSALFLDIAHPAANPFG